MRVEAVFGDTAWITTVHPTTRMLEVWIVEIERNVSICQSVDAALWGDTKGVQEVFPPLRNIPEDHP